VRHLASLLAAALVAQTARAEFPAAPPGAASAPSEVAGDARIPSSWLQKAKGYEKAVELQKQTGADIFVYFSRNTPNEQGLCSWFESKGLNDGKIRKYLRDYIKVEVPLPSNPDAQKLADEFEVGKCPIVFIQQTNGWRQACRVFDWPDGKPKLFEPEQLIELFRARSGDRYQKPASPAD
jgi:hypothetical protein